MITYLIEVSICWLLFYGIYILLLSKETFFNINRWYLLSTLILGLLIPLFTVEFSSFFYEEPTHSVVYLAEGFSELAYVIDTSVEEAKSVEYSWLTLLNFLYIIGVIVAFVRFLYGFRQIYGLYKAGTIVKKGNYHLILTQTPHLPFSFFNYLFWNEGMALEDKDSGKIITHELAHINQWHSLDVLLLEFLGIALWFSPPIYWYKKSLRTVHEYLADAYVLRDTKKKQYGHLLIRQVQSGMQVALANNFIHSQLKQRINMMTRNKSRRKALTRYLPVLPLLLLMVLVFSNKNVQQNFKETTAKANSALEELSPDVLKALIATEDVRFFDSKVVKQKLIDAYKIDDPFNFVNYTPTEADLKKMEDSKKIKNLHQEAKRLIAKYPKNENDIKALMKEVALEKGYKVRFNGDNIIYQSINKEIQAQEKESFKLLVVNGAIVGLTNSIIPSSEVQKLEELSPELAMEKFGKENGENGAVLITSEEWTVLESTSGETILVRKDAADLYDDGKHFFKMTDAEKSRALPDTPPLFPGGEKELLKFIYSNIKYPAEARNKGIYGNLNAQFIVEKDGSISKLKVKNDLGGGLKNEVLRVLKLVQEMPAKWTPATKDGVPIKTTYQLPFVYLLEGKGDDGTIFKREVLEKPKGIHIAIVGLFKNEESNTIDPIYKEVDEMPRFPGCEDKAGTKAEINTCAQQEMLQFIYTNIKYPAAARKAGIEGTVVVRFVVDKNGQIINREIVRSIGGGTDAEVLSTVGKMPNWIPGRKDGKVVSVVYNLPVKFKLAEDAKPLVLLNDRPYSKNYKEINKDAIKTIDILGGDEETVKIFGEKGKNGVIRIQLKEKIHLVEVTVKGIKEYRLKSDMIKHNKNSKIPTNLENGEPVYKLVDEMPLFPGCEGTAYSETRRNCANKKMLEFIYANVKYPATARKAEIEGVAVVRFVVEKDGTISDVEILRNPGEGTGEEALRVVNLMAEQNIKWTPGRQDGKPVNVNFNLPIKFKLGEESLKSDKKIIYHPSAPKIPIGYEGEATKLDLGDKTITMNVFPNPVREQMSITLEGSAKNVLLTVFDLNGKEYFSEKIQSLGGILHKTINLNNAPKGTLIVNVRHEGKDYQNKVVVQ